jgi:hypothetical protein
MSDLNLSYENLPVGIRRTPDKSAYEVGVVVGDVFLSVARLGLGHVDDLLASSLEDHAANAAATEQAQAPTVEAPVNVVAPTE